MQESIYVSTQKQIRINRRTGLTKQKTNHKQTREKENITNDQFKDIKL